MTLTKYNAAGEQVLNESGFAPQAVVFRAYTSANQAWGTNTFADIKHNVKEFDPFGWYDSTTGRFQPRLAGYYRLGAAVRISGGQRYFRFGKNNVRFPMVDAAADTGKVALSGSTLMYLNGTTDYATIQVYSSAPDANGVMGDSANENYTFFEAELVAASVGVAPEPWHVVGAASEPAFQNSWANYAGGYAPAAFFKDPHGIVHLRGLVKAGSVGLPIFTLPVGYRPAYDALIVVTANGVFGDIVIRAGNGTVVHDVGSTVWMSLENISFRGEQ